MSCSFLPNQTIASDLQWWQVVDTLAQNQTCGKTYVRPDNGGALQPWLYTAIQILIHLPVVYFRIVNWEDVQTLSIVLAVFNVAIISQAYTSTRFAADSVLVWSPIALVLDCGAMLQIMVLVRKEHPNWRRDFMRAIRPHNKVPNPELHNPDNGHQPGVPPIDFLPGDVEMQHSPNNKSSAALGEDPLLISTMSQSSTPHRLFIANPLGSKDYPKETDVKPQQPKFVAFVMTTSSLLFLAIFSLQIAGLVGAVRGQQAKDIKASWCSPMFALFGVSQLDLTCQFHPITSDPQRGIGCIQLPGVRQHTWLLVTAIALSISLITEVIDFVILCRLGPKDIWWKVHLERPFATMIVGLLVLFMILVVGTMDSYNLPTEIAGKVWLVVKINQPLVCTGILTPAGLRGQFLGWLDGLLQSWKSTYYGTYTL